MRMAPLRERTKAFASRIIRLYCSLPKSVLADTLGKQLLRSGTSVAANFREASRARSDAEFISKLGIVEQELDESLLWIELMDDADIFPSEMLASLSQETEELIKIIVTAIRNTKRKK